MSVNETYRAVAGLEQRVQELRQTRVAAEGRLGEVRKQLAHATRELQRLDGNAPTTASKRTRSPPPEPRSVVAKPHSDGEEEEKEEKGEEEEEAAREDAPPKRRRMIEETDEQTRARNKRMFGMLLGTLQRFSHEEETKHRAQERQRQETERDVEKETGEQLRQSLVQDVARLRAEEAKYSAEAESAGTEERHLQASVTETRWELQTTLVRRFRKTKTQPSICFASRDLLVRLATEPPPPVSIVEPSTMCLSPRVLRQDEAVADTDAQEGDASATQ